MPQLQISLDDDTYERLKTLAADTNASPEETAAQAVRDIVTREPGDRDVDSLVGELLEKYGRAFHRLAQ